MWMWIVDTVRPIAPVFTLVPPNPSTNATSHFDWTPHLPGAGIDHYECSTENGAFSTVVVGADGPPQPCAPPLVYVVQTTNNGVHQLAVRAVDMAGNVSPAISYSWKVDKGSGQEFTISGDLSGLLYPGGACRAVALTLTNPNDVPIYVTALTVGFGTMPAGCPASWFAINQLNVSATNTLTVPANGSVTLPHGTVTAPTVLMVDSGKQDACQGQSFGLAYDGSAHS